MTKNLSIVILTGAGISKESGLDTFRDADGIWSRVKLEDVATPEAFTRDPGLVHEFYNMRRATLAAGNIKPNPAHLALARLEAKWPGRVTVVSQNIDNLHEMAGSQNVIHMHGELLKARCQGCAGVIDWKDELSVSVACPLCSATGLLRPHVVWFGEMPMEMERIHMELADCAWFVSIGTSGNVYPASGFIRHVRELGRADTMEINLEPSQGASLFDDALYGPASETVPGFVERLLAGH